MGMKKQEAKNRTCADCLFHVCRYACFIKGNQYCNGHCTNSKHHKACFGAACEFYTFDEFYREYRG